MSIKSTRYDMARAVMEAVAFELRRAFEDYEKNNIHFDQLHVTGGGANSRIWQQILADVTKTPVLLPFITQSASWGAAVLAGMGIGLDLMKEATDSNREDRFLKPTNSDLYIDAYKKYVSLRDIVMHQNIYT